MQAQIAERWETQNEAGRRFYGRGDFARAEQAFAAAIREAEQLGPGDLRLATSLANLAQLKLRQRNFDEADRLFRRSLQIREAALGTDHASLVQTVNGLAAVCYARGDLDSAEPLFRRALSITERRLGAQHPDIVTSLNSLARIAFKRNDYVAAGPLLERLLILKESSLGPDHPESAPLLASLVKVRVAEGALDVAERLARRVVTIRESEQPPNELTLATALELLADVLARIGNRDEEQRTRQRAGALRGHQAASAGLMPLSPPPPNAAQDVYDPHPTPAGLRPSAPAPAAPPPTRRRSQPPAPAAPPPSLGDLLIYLPESAGTNSVGAAPSSGPRQEAPSPIPDIILGATLGPTSTPIPDVLRPVSTPLPEMPRISMQDGRDEIVTRRKTPPAAPPPLPDAPKTVVDPNATVEGAGAEIAPVPVAPPPRPAPAPAPVRHYEPPPRRPPRRRRESTSSRPRRRGGRKMVLALVAVLSVGAVAAAMGRGFVTESRGVTGEPSREFPARPRKPRAAAPATSRADSALAKSVRDSVALLLAPPPTPSADPWPAQSPEVNVPARGRRGDPLAQQIKKMLPDGPTDTTRRDSNLRQP
jgi:tetratricopeptide (TPR) repeat protein